MLMSQASSPFGVTTSQIAAITGTLSWFETRGDIGLILKVFGSDFPRADNLEMTPKPFPVGKTFLIVDKTTYPVDAYPCERFADVSIGASVKLAPSMPVARSGLSPSFVLSAAAWVLR